MGRALTCDICKKPTAKHVGKLFFTSLKARQTKMSSHNLYEFHLDVGECCKDRLMTGFAWRKRMTKEEYKEARRKPAA